MNSFEVGRFYRHTNGTLLHVLGEVHNSLMWRTDSDAPLLIAETDKGELEPLSRAEGADVNYAHATCDDFLSSLNVTDEERSKERARFPDHVLGPIPAFTTVQDRPPSGRKYILEHEYNWRKVMMRGPLESTQWSATLYQPTNRHTAAPEDLEFDTKGPPYLRGTKSEIEEAALEFLRKGDTKRAHLLDAQRKS